MSDKHFFDDMTRVMGSGLPRRQILKMMMGGLLSGSFGSLSLLLPEIAEAGQGNATNCARIEDPKDDMVYCNADASTINLSFCCRASKDETCCGADLGWICCSDGWICQDPGDPKKRKCVCPPDRVIPGCNGCCPKGKHYDAQTQKCVDNSATPQQKLTNSLQSDAGFCCFDQRPACGGNELSQGQCCKKDETCINNACCPDVQVCGSTCCSKDQTCISNSCCPTAQVCGSTCCSKDEVCTDGVCKPKFSCDQCDPTPCACSSTSYKASVVKQSFAKSAAQKAPHTQLNVTLQNAQSGIISIAIDKAVNCTVPGLPLDCGGDKNPIVLIATKIDESKSASVSFKVVPGPASALAKSSAHSSLIKSAAASTCADCCYPNPDCPPVDPVFTTLKINTGRTATQAFTEIPEAEHYIAITNGAPGLTRLEILLNGRYKAVKLSDNQTVNIDMLAATLSSTPGTPGTLTLVGTGPTGAGADIIVSDAAPLPQPFMMSRIRAMASTASLTDPSQDGGNWGHLKKKSEDNSALQSAQAGPQQIELHLATSLNWQSAINPSLYTALVNGVLVNVAEAVIASQNSKETVLLLALPYGSFKAGDAVTVAWDQLENTKGQFLSGMVNLVAN